MNVRFFAGTREQYDKLNAHNERALYFCSDTKELFWGDHLLTDGIRVVATHEDLPELANAADGVVYYVTETRNGYTRSPDKTEWLQTIYAPATNAYIVPEDEIYNTVTTVGAVRDVEKAIYAYIDTELAALAIPDLSKFITEIPAEYITEDELAAKGYITEHQSLEGLATETFVHEMIAKAELADKEADLEAYYTKDQIHALIPDVSGFITEIPEEYVTEAELSSKGYLTEHQSLDEYAKTQFVTKTTVAQKYEVLPVAGMLVSYRDNEVRLNTERVVPVQQSVGATGNPNMFYVTFRAYAPDDATGVIESDGAQTDTEPTALAIDTYGRKYATIWAAIANFNGTTWTKWGDSSTLDKYLGFYYTFKWFKEDKLIGTDKVRVILTNDKCHDDLVPDAVARRIDEKLKAIEIPEVNLDDYAKKADIPSVDGLATEAYVVEAIANIPEIDLSEYATKAEIPSLDDYAKTSDIPDVSNFITTIPEEYLTESELEARGYITDISDKADLVHNHDDLYDLKGAAQAIKDELLNGASGAYDTLKELGSLIDTNVDAIEALQTVAAGKADKEHAHSEYLTEHQSLEDYAKKSDIPTDYLTEIPSEYITIDELDAKGYLTEHQDLSAYAKQEDLNELASEAFVREQIEAVKLPEVPTKVSELENDAGYITSSVITDVPKLFSVTIPTPASYSAAGAFEFENYHNYAGAKLLLVKLDSREHIADVTKKSDTEYIVRFLSGRSISRFDFKYSDGLYQPGNVGWYVTPVESSITLATEQFVQDSIDALEITETDLSNYYNKSETETLVNEAVNGIEIPEVPVKVSELENDAGYLTQHQPLDDYAKKVDIPSIDGLASETYVDEKVANVRVDLAGYATESWVESKNYLTEHQDISIKADKILFTTSKFVNNPIGNFKIGDDVKDLTIAELFAKLLGLSDEIVTPDQPDIPEEPESIVDNIILKQLPMYSVTIDGELAEVPYKYLAFTEESATIAPVESGFYQTKDTAGNIIESGYQELQVDNGDVYYVMALPKDIDFTSMVSVQVYDTLRNIWTDTSLDMTNDTETVAALCDEVGIDISHVDTSVYTIWALEDVPTGSKLRFIINE